MAQLTLYIPDDLAAELKRDARSKGLSVSRYAAGMLAKTEDCGWPSGYFENVCGFLHEPMQPPPDAPPEPLSL